PATTEVATTNTPAVTTAPANPPATNTAPRSEPAPATTAAPPAPERVPALDSAGLPQGWVVRLGVFGNRSNADGLLQRLLDARYKAYVETMPDARNMTGVYVGPVLTRAEADTLLRELRTRFQLEGMVRRFNPE
ncbi:MAG: SPOR domain-containing protein, partial [Pseudomonadales bacterium]|nr:SPOR domain-containing protein [Pseudomonadales bacterium]